MATLAVLLGDATTAARLFGIADTLCDAAGAFLPVVDRDAYRRVVATARAALGEAAFDAASGGGRRAPFAEAVALGVADRLAGGRADGGGGRGDEPAPPSGAAGRFAPRERDVARLVAQETSNAEIARQLGLSPYTIPGYVARIRRKLGLRNRAALAAYAVRHRLV